MTWTETTRAQHRRDGLRYASDTTDVEWVLIEPYLPSPCRLGRPREVVLRAVLDGILFVLRSGCQWRMLPKDCPPRSAVQRRFYRWRKLGLWAQINYALLMQVRDAAGRQGSPSAGIINSQSVKTTESGGPKGYDAGKKVSGRKRYIVTDTMGFLVGLLVFVQLAATKRGLAAALHSGDPAFDALPARRELRLKAAIKTLFQTAIAAVAFRRDIDSDEFLNAAANLCMLAHDGRPNQVRRMVALLVDGLRHQAV